MCNVDAPWAGLEPEDLIRALAEVRVAWWFAGGWALDLYLGSSTRDHADIDVSVFRDEFSAFAAPLEGWAFFAADGTLTRWRWGEGVPKTIHTFWVRPTGSPRWSFEVLLEDRDGRDWLCRRDPGIRLPADQLTMDRGGYRFVRPEVQLLYKAKDPRPKDEEDFTRVCERLSRDARAWLYLGLKRLHPGHPWLPASAPSEEPRRPESVWPISSSE